MDSTETSHRERAALVVLFGLALAAHLYFATSNWTSGFLPGHEFRQTQTALISYYIEAENNFSLHYSTPLLGKPWAFPLEFPLYEWSVVLLSRATHLPHFEAARTVSLVCFYLALPAVWLLLGQVGLAPPRRLPALALILTCPVYIFYSRAFLMESMVLMFSVWFLAAFVRTMRERRFHWLVLCALCGVAAGLIKSLTFFVWLVPAALFGAWYLWRDLRTRAGWPAVRRTLAWGLGAVILPGLAVYWWVKFTDAIKAGHPSAYIFTSRNLTAGNFGLYNLGARFSFETWRTLWARWREAIMPPWVAALIVLGGAALSRHERWHILGAAGLFIVAQMLFPYAYAYQDYYFYACTFFILGAMGLVLHGLLDSGLPRWSRWVLLLVPFAFQLSTYLGGYHVMQSIRSNGGTGLTDALKAYTPPGSILIIGGDDWNPAIAYYSQRKALMIRNGLEDDGQYLQRAFDDLAGEEISALVLVGAQRANEGLVRRAAARFDLDRAVTFSYSNADVYMSNHYRENVLIRLLEDHGYEQITTKAKRAADAPDSRPIPIPAGIAGTAFGFVSPAPYQYRSTYGISPLDDHGARVFSAHPDSDLWVRPPPAAREIVWEFGILAGAYEKAGDRTNGVEFAVVGERPDGRRREIYRRLLDPAAVAADRGRQRAAFQYQALPGESLVFSTRPNHDYAYDWAYWAGIEIH